MQKVHHHYLYSSHHLWLTAVTSTAAVGAVLTATINAQASDQQVVKNNNEHQQVVFDQQNPTITKLASAPSSVVKQPIDSDQQVQEHLVGLDGKGFSGQLLGHAGTFHIFSNVTTIHADVNGNIATSELVSAPEFGTRGQTPNHTDCDLYYIVKTGDVGANAFRGKNYVVLGTADGVMIRDGRAFINGQRMDHLNAADVHCVKNFLVFEDEFGLLRTKADQLGSHQSSDGVKVSLTDMNKRTVDVSGAQQQGMIYVNLSADLLSQPQPITITGISSDAKGAAIVINVIGAGNRVDVNTQAKLVYDNGQEIHPGESHAKPNHVLWNFGNGVKTININSGYFMGSILAPNATLNIGVNVNGGETHRWDLYASVPPAEIPQPVIPHADDEFVKYQPDGSNDRPAKDTDQGKPTDDPGKPNQDQPVEPDHEWPVEEVHQPHVSPKIPAGGESSTTPSPRNSQTVMPSGKEIFQQDLLATKQPQAVAKETVTVYFPAARSRRSAALPQTGANQGGELTVWGIVGFLVGLALSKKKKN